MSTQYSFPSFVGQDKLTPSPRLTFRVEIKGTVIVARRAGSLRELDRIFARNNLVNGGVPGLPNISGQDRAALHYLKKLLERSLIVGLQEPSPYGRIIVSEDSERNHWEKSAWQIRYDPDLLDNSNVLHTVNAGFWKEFGLEPGEKIPDYAMVGIAIVSPDLRWDEENKWGPTLVQLEKDLALGDRNLNFTTHNNYSKYKTPNLSIHFTVEGQDKISIGILQQTLGLYGLWETRIDGWMHSMSQKVKASLPRKLRLGMEKLLVDKPIPPAASFFSTFLQATRNKRQQAAPNTRGFVLIDDLAHFYTHEEFASVIYERLQWSEMKTKVAGYPANTHYSDGSMRPCGSVYRDNTTVNISEPNVGIGKQMSVEFRHHPAPGTMSETIWWIQFCGYLFHYAVYLGNLHVKIGDLRFVEEIVRRDLFDLINFPEAGKAYFDRLTPVEGSAYKRKLDLDESLIQRRRTKRREYCLASDVPHEISNLEAILDTYPESNNMKALLPVDLPFVTEVEWPSFINYLRLAKRILSENHETVPPVTKQGGAHPKNWTAERYYWGHTVLNQWIEFTGHPRLRLARMERGFVPEMYAHTDEMSVDWNGGWIITGKRPKYDVRYEDGSVVVGSQTKEDTKARRKARRSRPSKMPRSDVSRDETEEVLVYEDEENNDLVLESAPVTLGALEIDEESNSPYPGETFYEHLDRVKREKKNF